MKQTTRMHIHKTSMSPTIGVRAASSQFETTNHKGVKTQSMQPYSRLLHVTHALDYSKPRCTDLHPHNALTHSQNYSQSARAYTEVCTLNHKQVATDIQKHYWEPAHTC